MSYTTKPKYTIKDCNTEIVRLLRLYFYSKTTEQEKQQILNNVKINLESLARLEAYKLAEAEQRKADKEAKKMGIYR